jgi:hypothetical protein
VNRSLARTKPGSSPDATRGRPARTNGTLHSRLKITSSIRRQSHRQDRPKPGLHMRELRCERRTAGQRELPQPLPGVPVLQAPRHRPRRPGLGLPQPDAPRAYRAPRRQRAHASPPVRGLRLRPAQPDRRRPRARRRHRRDHRADAQSRVAPACRCPRELPRRHPSHINHRGDGRVRLGLRRPERPLGRPAGSWGTTRPPTCLCMTHRAATSPSATAGSRRTPGPRSPTAPTLLKVPRAATGGRHGKTHAHSLRRPDHPNHPASTGQLEELFRRHPAAGSGLAHQVLRHPVRAWRPPGVACGRPSPVHVGCCVGRRVWWIRWPPLMVEPAAVPAPLS